MLIRGLAGGLLFMQINKNASIQPYLGKSWDSFPPLVGRMSRWFFPPRTLGQDHHPLITQFHCPVSGLLHPWSRCFWPGSWLSHLPKPHSNLWIVQFKPRRKNLTTCAKTTWIFKGRNLHGTKDYWKPNRYILWALSALKNGTWAQRNLTFKLLLSAAIMWGRVPTLKALMAHPGQRIITSVGWGLAKRCN